MSVVRAWDPQSGKLARPPCLKPVRYSQVQAAAQLGVSVPTLRKWLDRGLLPYEQVGRRVYISAAALAGFRIPW
jgi:excisionase family DNA binding protein